ATMIATLTIGKRRAFSPSESGSTARILHLRRCRRIGDVVKAAVARACSSSPSVSRCRCGQPPHCSPIAYTLVQAGRADEPARVLLTALSIGSVALAWSCVQTVYALRYGRLYLQQADRRDRLPRRTLSRLRR